MFQPFLRPQNKNIAKATKRSLEWQLQYMQDQLARAQAMTEATVTKNDGTTVDRIAWIAETEAEILLHQNEIAVLDSIIL